MTDKIPVGSARELAGRDRHRALVEEFGFEESATMPMPLDELPHLRGRCLLPPTEAEMVRRRLGGH